MNPDTNDGAVLTDAVRAAIGQCALVVPLGLCILTGCSAHHTPPLRTTSKIARVLTREEARLAVEFDKAAISSSSEKATSGFAARVMKSDNPFLIGFMMLDMTQRLSLAQTSCADIAQKERIRALICECLSRDDEFLRLVGIWVAEEIGDGSVVRRVLFRDPSFLLVIPRVTPWWASPWWSERGSPFNRLQPMALLFGMRESAIGLIGKYNVQSAKPVLEVIANDKYGEEHEVFREAARDALAVLDATPELDGG